MYRVPGRVLGEEVVEPGLARDGSAEVGRADEQAIAGPTDRVDGRDELVRRVDHDRIGVQEEAIAAPDLEAAGEIADGARDVVAVRAHREPRQHEDAQDHRRRTGDQASVAGEPGARRAVGEQLRDPRSGPGRWTRS